MCNFPSELFLQPGIVHNQFLIVTVTVAFRYQLKTSSTRFAITPEIQLQWSMKPQKPQRPTKIARKQYLMATTTPCQYQRKAGSISFGITLEMGPQSYIKPREAQKSTVHAGT